MATEDGVNTGLIVGLMDGETSATLLNEVTFVITVRERCRHLRRALDYYSRFPVRVIVMDSSDRRCRVDKHPREFRHLHLPHTFLVDAISKTLAKVTTPYCIIASDDDFFVPRAVAELVRFLKNNPKFQSTQGLYGRFQNTGEVELQQAYPHMVGYEVTAETPQERVIQHLGHYVTHYHAVHRTDHLRVAINCGRTVKNFSANEIVTGATTAMGGKLKVLPLLYCIREVLESSQSALLGRGVQNVKFHTSLSNAAQHAHLIHECESILCRELESYGLSPEDAFDSVQKAFEAYRRFVVEFSLRSERWQEEQRRLGTPNFAQVLADPETFADWETIKSVIVEHDLSPYVPPLLVDDDGHRIRRWRDTPAIFHLIVFIKNFSLRRMLHRWLAGVRSAFRTGTAR